MTRENAHVPDDRKQERFIRCEPALPKDWRDQLAWWRRQGLPNSPEHQRAYRNLMRACSPDHVETTDPDARDQIEAWWVLVCLRGDAWRYWLTVPDGERE